MLDFASKTSEGIRNTTTMFESQQGRRRPPRALHAGTISEYNQHEAQARCEFLCAHCNALSDVLCFLSPTHLTFLQILIIKCERGNTLAHCFCDLDVSLTSTTNRNTSPEKTHTHEDIRTHKNTQTHTHTIKTLSHAHAHTHTPD